MFPDPVDAFCGLVSKITAVEITAQKKIEPDVPPIGAAKLAHLHGLFLPALVRIGEIPGRFRLEKKPVKLLSSTSPA